MYCLECNKLIQGKRKDAIYCSSKCRNNHRQKRYRIKNLDHVRQTWRNYSDTTNGTASLLLNYAKDRAKRYDLPFDLDKEFVLEKLNNGRCELTDLPFSKQLSQKRGRNPMTPSLDRINPKLGYVKSNVRLICFGLNAALGDWGESIYVKLATAYMNKKV